MDFTKPRVAIYYFVVPSTGYRNDGAPLFMNYNFRKILNGNTQMDNDTGNVVHLWPSIDTSHFGKFDLNVLVDHGEDAIQVPLDWKIPSPSAYWVSDAHLGYEYRMKRAKEFDYVFVAQKEFIKQFVMDGIDPKKIFYMPHAAEQDVYRPYEILEKWDWSFIGHLNSNHRIDLVQRFVTEFGLQGNKGYLGWRMPEVAGHNVLDDVAKKFSQSRLVINDNIKDDVNMRTFESLACRRPLITQDIPELHGLFEDKNHLFMYRSIDEAVEIAKQLLKDPNTRNHVAEMGYQEVMSKHTYNHRALEMLKVCLNYEPKTEIKGVLQSC